MKKLFIGFAIILVLVIGACLVWNLLVALATGLVAFVVLMLLVAGAGGSADDGRNDDEDDDDRDDDDD